MKILKKAEQKNVVVANEFYTDNELENMMSNKTTWFFNSEYDICYDFEIYKEMQFEGKEIELRIFTSDCKELKVVLENGHYTTAAILNNGEKVFIEL